MTPARLVKIEDALREARHIYSEAYQAKYGKALIWNHAHP